MLHVHSLYWSITGTVPYGALHGVHEMGMSVSPYDANHGSCADARRWFWFGGWTVARQHQIRNLQRLGW